MDKITLARIALLHPFLRNESLQIYKACYARLTGKMQVRFTHTLRTFEAQNSLYAQGRIVPGRKVTWAKGGKSYHNYGLAVDICLLSRDKKEVSWDTLQDYDNDGISDWMEIVAVFEAYGWTWGGRWKRPKTDIPHFPKTLGYSIEQLYALHKQQNKTYVDLG